MKLQMGIIGFGKSTNRYHLPYILNRDNIKVKKIFSRTIKKELEESYNEENIEFVRNVKDILEDKDIKLVTICTHVDSHYGYAKECLLKGKNVLVEKPFTNTLEEAKELFAIAKRENLVISPYQNRRFDSDFLALKEVIESGKIGDVVEVESHFDYFRPDNTLNEGSRRDGAFYGLGVHTIDQIIYLFGNPEKVYYDIRSIRNRKNPDDYYEVQLFYKDFKVMVKTSHLVKSPYPKIILHGSKGSFIKYGIDKQEECLKAGIMPKGNKNFGLDIKDNYGVLDYVDENGKEIKEIVKTQLGDYGRVYDNLYNAIIKGEEVLVKEEEALMVMNILHQGLEGETPKIIKIT